IRDMKRDGIELQSSSLSSISGNFINNCGEPAITLYNSSYATVENNTLIDIKWGILTRNATSLAVSNITGGGMYLSRSSSSSVSGNLIKNCADKAIALLTLTDVTVENNTLVDSMWGIFSEDTTSLVVRNMKEDGMHLRDTAMSSIRGNSINNCEDPAISLYYSSHITVENNTLVDSKWGIESVNAISLAVR
ncbi:hypothetical protein THAOC_35823, partial [Thalassiosira oceanica]